MFWIGELSLFIILVQNLIDLSLAITDSYENETMCSTSASCTVTLTDDNSNLTTHWFDMSSWRVLRLVLSIQYLGWRGWGGESVPESIKTPWDPSTESPRAVPILPEFTGKWRVSRYRELPTITEKIDVWTKVYCYIASVQPWSLHVLSSINRTSMLGCYLSIWLVGLSVCSFVHL